MLSVKTRRLAVPVVVACVGVLGSATAAHAQSGGLSVTPASLENRAKLGTVGSLTLNNTTKESLRVTVTVRPWRQQLNGTVVADPRSNLTRYVRATTRSFTIGAGTKRPISFRMVRRLSSLYAGVDILGKPTNTKGRKGIIPNYRLISKLRLNPAKKTYRFRTGAAQVRSGSHHPAGPQPRQLDRPDRRHVPPVRRGLEVRQHGRGRRAPGQARRPEPRLHARDEEGHLHRQRDGQAGQQVHERAYELHDPVRSGAVETGLHARSHTDQVRSRRGRRRRLGVATPGRVPGVARDGPGHPARRARPCRLCPARSSCSTGPGSSRRSTLCRPPRTSRCPRRSTGSCPWAAAPPSTPRRSRT